MKLQTEPTEFKPVTIVIETMEELKEIYNALENYAEEVVEQVNDAKGRFKKKNFRKAYYQITIINKDIFNLLP